MSLECPQLGTGYPDGLSRYISLDFVTTTSVSWKGRQRQVIVLCTGPLEVSFEFQGSNDVGQTIDRENWVKGTKPTSAAERLEEFVVTSRILVQSSMSYADLSSFRGLSQGMCTSHGM